MGVESGIAASGKCCMRSPEGPAAVPLGKERRVDKISKAWSNRNTSGATGGEQLGCLDCSNCQVASLLGAKPIRLQKLCKLY